MTVSKPVISQALHDLFKHFTMRDKPHDALEAIREAVFLDASSYRSNLRAALTNVFKDYEHCREWWKETLNFVEGATAEIRAVYKLELDQALRDAFEDAVLMGVDEDAMRRILVGMVAALPSPKRPAGR